MGGSHEPTLLRKPRNKDDRENRLLTKRYVHTTYCFMLRARIDLGYGSLLWLVRIVVHDAVSKHLMR